MVTVESLALEVTPLLGSLLALKTANCLFFGDDVVYGDYSNVAQCSSKGNDALGKNKQRDGKKKGCNKGCSSQKPDGLKAALSDMKKTIQNALCDEAGDAGNYAAEIKNLRNEVEIMKKENASLRKSFDEIKETLQKVLAKINLNEKDKTVKAEEQSKAEKKPDADDFELFGSSDEEEDEEKQRIIQERLKAYAEKKARKPASVAKSSVILDVKPWDDETDMVEMEKRVRAIEQDGLLWGGSKLIPLAYGLKKLQIISTIEDEKVSVDDLIDRMVEEISEHIQSVDIVAFNKI